MFTQRWECPRLTSHSSSNHRHPRSPQSMTKGLCVQSGRGQLRLGEGRFKGGEAARVLLGLQGRVLLGR